MVTLCYGVDIALDIHQTNTYYELFINGTTQTNDTGYFSTSNLTSSLVSTPSYLFAAGAAWICVPLLWSIFSLLIITQNPFSMINRFLNLYLDYEIKLSYGKMGNFVIGVLALPIDIVASAVWLYVMMPYVSLKRALQTAILNRKFDKEDNISVDLPIEGLRALPQLILAIIFTVKEYRILRISDEYFDIPVPMSIISIAFSGLSLFIGVLTGASKVMFFNTLKATMVQVKF